MALSKNSKYDKKGFGSPNPGKDSKTTPAGSVFKSNPVYKGDKSPKTYPKPGSGQNQ